MLIQALERNQKIFVKQKKELVELVGFETRNKYSIENKDGGVLGFAAEKSTGIGGFFGRQLLGHYRSFTVAIFDQNRNLLYEAIHPFRFFFQRLELYTNDGKIIGAIEQRFGLLKKKFDFLDANENIVMTMSAPLWKVWTFPIYKNNEQVALILKQWSGLLKEVVTDADNFSVEIKSSALSIKEKELILAAAIFVDICFFEDKASN